MYSGLFSDQLIFFDTEFTSLDPYRGELLSVGMIKADGAELYLEIERTGLVSDWVREHVLPKLTGQKVSRDEAVRKILEFVGRGGGTPYLISYVNQYDAAYLFKLLGVTDRRKDKEFLFHWIILDFASVLFGAGYDPEMLSLEEKRNVFLHSLGIDRKRYHLHNALDDARLLRDVYGKLFRIPLV